MHIYINLMQTTTVFNHFIVFKNNDSFIYLNFHNQRQMHMYIELNAEAYSFWLSYCIQKRMIGLST